MGPDLQQRNRTRSDMSMSELFHIGKYVYRLSHPEAWSEDWGPATGVPFSTLKKVIGGDGAQVIRYSASRMRKTPRYPRQYCADLLEHYHTPEFNKKFPCAVGVWTESKVFEALEVVEELGVLRYTEFSAREMCSRKLHDSGCVHIEHVDRITIDERVHTDEESRRFEAK